MKQSIHKRKALNGGESFPDLHMTENKYQGYIRNQKIRIGNANDLLKYVYDLNREKRRENKGMNRMGWGTVKKGMSGCKSVEEGSGEMQGL